MKKSQIFFICFLIVASHLSAGVLTLKGYYQGKNLRVQNVSGTVNEKCVIAVYVNGVKIMDHPQESVFEINLGDHKIGESIVVKIQHVDGCIPRVLNKQVIRPASRFNFSDIKISEEGIKWSTKGEAKHGKMMVQQLTRQITQNTWEDIGNVDTKGSLSLNEYFLKINHFSGHNKYRIKYVEDGGLTFYSEVMSYDTQVKVVTFYPKRVTDKITFTARNSIPYRVYDSSGALILEGHGLFINCNTLKKHETYTLIYDNHIDKFLKK